MDLICYHLAFEHGDLDAHGLDHFKMASGPEYLRWKSRGLADLQRLHARAKAQQEDVGKPMDHRLGDERSISATDLARGRGGR